MSFKLIILAIAGCLALSACSKDDCKARTGDGICVDQKASTGNHT